MSGWIKVHRQLLDNPVFKNHKLLQTFLYCLLKASHQGHEQLVGDSIVSLKAGQLATGRKAISGATGLTEQNVRTALNKLEKLQILTIKPQSKYSIISIVNWDKHQITNQQVTNNQPTSNQQVTTNKKVKNEKNVDSKVKKENVPYQKIAELYNEACPNLSGIQSPSNLSDKRKQAIKKFWEHHNLNQNSEFYDDYFERANSIPFLNGVNDRNWKADFDFIMKTETHEKVMEGKYV